MLPLHDDSRRPESFPLVTGALIALNVFVFLYQFSLDPTSANDFAYAYGFVPDHFRWLTIFTSMFLHASWMHIISNMVFLWVFGPNIEDLLGHGRYLIFYLLCGAAAALVQYAVSPDSRIPQVGASGAISGVMGAYLIKFPTSRIRTVSWFIVLFSFELPAWLLLVWFIGLQFLNGVGSIADVQTQRGGVAYFAHIGGFFAGMILISLMKTSDRRAERRDLSW
jgi:membrane associated rhomboid family serine protease